VKKRQKSSEAESLKQINIKYPTHLKIALQTETYSERQWKPTYNKAAGRRKHNLQNPLNNTVQQDTKIYVL
jgi:hypothetical protein